jgi:hypothetical protein
MESEAQQMAKFIVGLRLPIQGRVTIQNVFTLTVAVSLTTRIERQLGRSIISTWEWNPTVSIHFSNYNYAGNVNVDEIRDAILRYKATNANADEGILLSRSLVIRPVLLTPSLEDKFQHKGHGIVYIVFRDGRKIIFQLLKEDPVDTIIQATKRPILLTEWAKFFKEVNEARGVLALVLGRINSPTMQAIPEMVCLMLEEFWDEAPALLVSNLPSYFLLFMHQALTKLHLEYVGVFPTNLVFFSTLNWVDIFECFSQEASDFNSRTSYFQEGEFDVGQHLPASLLNPKLRKRSTMAWKRHLLVKILQWKYRRKSTQRINLIIASRFIYSLSKREPQWKETENEENSQMSVLTIRSREKTLFTRENIVHVYCISPEKTLLTRGKLLFHSEHALTHA